MRVAIKMHNGFEEHDAVHQDTIISLISLDTSLIWNLLCILIARIAF
jgi:hypothetical protein